jgi:NADP-dependent 3-hydroxy acid dehydrogenase YdfG
MELKNKVTVITGASSGIGKACAETLLAKECIVYGLNRNKSSIQHPNFKSITCDIRDRMQVETAINKIIQEHGRIDILINNAGLGHFGKIDEIGVDQWHEMFDTNVHGVFYCMRSVIPAMKKNNSGHIINIASIAGKQAVPEGSGYSATKFAVRAIGESVYRELRPFNIKLTTIYPGSTNTNFFSRLESKLSAEEKIQPNDIAESVVQILETNPDYLPSELEIRTMRAK